MIYLRNSAKISRQPRNTLGSQFTASQIPAAPPGLGAIGASPFAIGAYGPGSHC